MNSIKSLKIVIILFSLFLGTNVLAQQALPKDLLITLERSPCYGSCPFYKLTISANGKVTFEPKSISQDYKLVTGKTLKGSITKDQLKQLISEFEKINFFSLKDGYGKSWDYSPDENCPEIWTDASSAETAITMNGKTKTVSHYHGCVGSNTLENLTKLEDRIDEIVNTNQWLVRSK